MSIPDTVSMFYNAKPHIFEKAKMLRRNMTASELKLWECLRDAKVCNLRFRPQHPIDIFIADFYCHPLKMVVEVDGSIHKLKEQAEYDIGREAELKNWGISVIRFTNEEIDQNINSVIDQIEKACIKRKAELLKPERQTSASNSPLQGVEGEKATNIKLSE